MIDSLIAKDIELLIFLNNLGTERWDGFWLVMTNKYSAIPLYLFLIWASYKQFGFKKTSVIVVGVLLTVTFSDQTSQFFKYYFMRLRPCWDENIIPHIRMVKESCGGRYSYFSAHAANAMAVAGFFSLVLKNKLPKLPVLLMIWATVVAYSRVYLAVHFPADIITGLFFGAMYAFLVFFIFKKIDAKYLS